MMRSGWQNPWVRAVTTLLTAAVMMMIFCFSMEDAEASDKRSGKISLQIIRIIHPDYEQMDAEAQQAIYDNVQYIVRKCAHFTEYMILGFAIRLCFESWFGLKIKKQRPLTLAALGAAAAYACTDELHQLAIDGRSGQWTDVLVDSSGVLAGAVLGALLIRMLSRTDPDGTAQG